ncbi:MAG: trigger factor [Oscillospiraceae bacterium]|nr:trigger factor [Oscillospiraceae bacterium]
METKNIEKKEKKVVFDVVVDAKTFEDEVQKSYLRNRSRIAVPGFRRGKAPRKVIEGMYGKDVFHDEAVDALALEAFKSGVEASGERTAGDPAITDYKVDEDGALTISYEAALYPEAALGEYKGLTAYKPAVEVSEEEIDTEVEAVRKRNARIASVERGAQKDDTVIIDFDGFRDGKRFAGGKGKDYHLKLGSGAFVPGFEDQLIGAVAGEEREVNVTFPDNYAEELAGADAMFKVKVHEVQETQLPDLDDEFAKDISEFDTLAEYRDSVREELKQRKQERLDNEFRQVLMRKAADNVEVEIPDAMVNARVNSNMEELSRRVAAQGMSMGQYLQMMGMNEQLYRSYIRPAVTSEIRVELMLEKVAQTEGIEVGAEEIEAEYKRLSDEYDMELDRVREIVPEDVVKRDLEMQKASDVIVEAAIATDEPEQPAAPAEPEEAEDAVTVEPVELEAPAEIDEAAKLVEAEEAKAAKPERTLKSKKAEEGEAGEQPEKPKRTRKTKKAETAEPETPAEE